MGNGELHVIGQGLVLFHKFLGNHIEHVMKLVLCFFRRASNRVTAFNRRNIGDVTAVVIAPANDLIIEQRLHEAKIAGDDIRNL